MKIEAIIFDCFGVLYVDFSTLYGDRFSDKIKQQIHEVSALSDRGLISRQDYMQAVSKITGDSIPTINAAFRREHKINQPLIELIQSKLKPRYKIGMLSNIGREWMQDFFDEHQLHDLFDIVVISSEEGVTKPNPLVFERTAERLGVTPAACLMIDDRPENCAGAEAVGMKSIYYKNFAECKEALQKLTDSRLS